MIIMTSMAKVVATKDREQQGNVNWRSEQNAKAGNSEPVKKEEEKARTFSKRHSQGEDLRTSQESSQGESAGQQEEPRDLCQVCAAGRFLFRYREGVHIQQYGGDFDVFFLGILSTG